MRSSTRFEAPRGPCRRRPTRRTGDPSPAAGFTLLELLVTLAILGIVLTLTVPALLSLGERRRLLGDGEQVLVYFQRARYQSIQRNRPLRVDLDLASGVLFIDSDGDGTLDPVERSNGVFELSRGVLAGGPPGDSAAIDGFSTLGGRPVALFRPDGSVLAGGALRLRDVAADDFLEVRVIEPATGLTRLRKWDGSAWREKGEGGESWDWN